MCGGFLARSDHAMRHRCRGQLLGRLAQQLAAMDEDGSALRRGRGCDVSEHDGLASTGWQDE